VQIGKRSSISDMAASLASRIPASRERPAAADEARQERPALGLAERERPAAAEQASEAPPPMAVLAGEPTAVGLAKSALQLAASQPHWASALQCWPASAAAVAPVCRLGR
jgi:hypothetical protein